MTSFNYFYRKFQEVMHKKGILFFFLIAVVIFSCHNGSAVQQGMPGYTEGELQGMDTANFTTMEWMDSILNLDTIIEGEKKSLVFRFKNTGDKPLYLSDVRPTCGCTITDYTKNAVMPGQMGQVTGIFNSANHPGSFRKAITAKANTRNIAISYLIFTGFAKDTSANN